MRARERPILAHLMYENIRAHYHRYLEILKTLCSYRSRFTHPEEVDILISYLREQFSILLPHYKVYLDSKKNLVAIPKALDAFDYITILSAHADTVDADETQWDYPYSPWEIYEGTDELVARGVNDCKAGVAYQLFLAELIAKNVVNISGLIFTITYKEEGAGEKTSQAIAKALGKTIPLGQKETYLIVLENNTRPPNTAEDTSAELSIYTAERGNYAIQVKTNLEELKVFLDNYPRWNPVSCSPLNKKITESCRTILQEGGHVCSISKEDNLLFQTIMRSEQSDLIWAGDTSNFAMLPTTIQIEKGKKPFTHQFVLSNRSFDSVEQVTSQLQSLSYISLKDFSISQGMDIRDIFSGSRLETTLGKVETKTLDLNYTHNHGCSDASIIYASMQSELKSNFFPIVMGPGSRSQRTIIPPRLTHGKNETYDKAAGLEAVTYISEVISKLTK